KFNREYGKNVGSFVGWNLIGALAVVAKEQGVNVVLNMFFGPAVNAARGVAYQVLSKLNGFVGNFQMAMNPQIIKNYASGEIESMYKLVF
ncbi:UNVERIFIED_CONTAM: lipopolysaccharide biosynthesis protein, partial [Bacteroidetes bacterium 56_B9]